MERHELTCIGCPMGCALIVETKGKEILSIEGYTCERGRVYAEKEVTAPTRIVTSTVRVEGNGRKGVVSVKTQSDIPKEKVFDCVRALKEVTVQAPVFIGEVILENVAGTGSAAVATSAWPCRQTDTAHSRI